MTVFTLTPAEVFAWPAVRPVTAVRVAESCPVLIWARFDCGVCGGEFTADPVAVPKFAVPGWGDGAVCLPCWERGNRLRGLLWLPPRTRAPAYPQDWPPEGVL